MWLGVAAGLALLTWFTILPVIFAAQITFNDLRLTYVGEGWQNAQSPQICNQVSPTMHSTSTLGDSVDFTFSGSGVIIWGPVTLNPLPVVVILDNEVQPLVAPQACTGGCGVIYANENLPDTLHTVTILFPQANGTSVLSICGITITANGGDFPQLRQPQPSITATPTGTKVIPLPTVPSVEPSPPSVATTAFITTRGMIIAIIGSIIGAIVAMSVLLFIFIRVRRRITRYAARLRDRENSFDREARDQEPKHSFSILSSTSYTSDSKNNINTTLMHSGPSRARASITISTVSSHTPFSIRVASGLG
ncbi:hypothetical protein Clacol_008854 [Clathrus columnatus]|uniref:Uncharacterized protein n=1 Tax=Clathrus columnatus TaxID=1419009 RepID=A0AAV5ANE5_9AGAM|nr:hypothetical protein Clacol_008854 [Clathrus columnatus]